MIFGKSLLKGRESRKKQNKDSDFRTSGLLLNEALMVKKKLLRTWADINKIYIEQTHNVVNDNWELEMVFFG